MPDQESIQFDVDPRSVLGAIKQMNAAMALEILSDPSRAEGVVVIDGPTQDCQRLAFLATKTKANKPWAGNWPVTEKQYPTQADVLRPGWRDAVLVGRLREDDTVEHGLNLWVVSDNLRKGAATNVVQIAEGMLERGLLG